ncbi:MAG: FYDLN acid domain-containing protein [Myxococcota bacterium]
MVKAPGPRRELGTRYTCFACGTKFYDLHRPVPTCPKCEADQRDDPELQASQAPPVKRAPPKKRPPAPTEPVEVGVDEPAEEEDEFGTTDLEDDDFDEEEIG